MARVKASRFRGVTAARLSVAARETSPDIVYLVGTNALAFAPVSKFLGGKTRILRHVFTSYDQSDRAIRPVRWFANVLFIDSYAFTTPRIGPWAGEHAHRTKRFLIRPPINCDLYRPVLVKDDSTGLPHEHSILYMGPLWGSRFPAVNVLRGLKLLAGRGVEASLLVLTSASRTSTLESEKLVEISRDLGMEDKITVTRVDLSEEQRVREYNKADVVIFPYAGPLPERLADPPFGILEAMSCGSIVLATDVLSISEVLRNGETGFLARDSSPLAIAEGLYHALTAPDLERVRGRARQRILTDFSYPQIRQKLLDAFAAVLD